MLFLDDISHFLWVFPLRGKSDVFTIVSNFYIYAQNQFKTTIQLFQCDNDHEFNNQALLNFLHNKGIKIMFSCPCMSQQNGKVKRVIRSINNSLLTYLFQALLSPKLWGDTLLIVMHTLNLLPTTTLSFNNKFELLFVSFPTYNHL